MTGGVNIRTQRDRLGREYRKTVGVGTKKHSQKQYNWGIGNHLQNIQNELKSTTINFEYDVFDNLIRADYQDNTDTQTIYRTPDAIGNYYQTPNKSDRNGGNLFLIYEHSTNIGFNMGKETIFMRIEITSGKTHSHPISEADVRKYLKCK